MTEFSIMVNNLHFGMYQQSNHIAILKRNKHFRISETKVLLCPSFFIKLTPHLCSFLCTWRKTNIRHKSCFMFFLCLLLPCRLSDDFTYLFILTTNDIKFPLKLISIHIPKILIMLHILTSIHQLIKMNQLC